MCQRGKIITILNSSFKLCSESEFDLFSWDTEIRRDRRTLRKCAHISPSVSKSNHQNQKMMSWQSCPIPVVKKYLNFFLISYVLLSTSLLPLMQVCCLLSHIASFCCIHVPLSTPTDPAQAVGEHDMSRKSIRKCLQHVAVSDQVEGGKWLGVT